MKNNTTKDVFATFLAKSVAAGQTDCVIPLGTAELRAEYDRKFLKCIKADELLDLCGGSVTTADCIAVDGFAFWAGVQTTELNGYLYRHRLLALCRSDGCRVYAIPVPLLERKFTLPDIALADGEMETYRLIADHISSASQEYIRSICHPAKSAIKSNRQMWTAASMDRSKFASLLQEHADWIYPLITAALDTQFRSFKACADVPIFFYNFTIKKAKLQADYVFSQVMTALNLTVDGESCNAAPEEITVQTGDDLKDWFGCHGRLVILRAGKGSGTAKLFEQNDAYHRQLSYGSVLPPKLPTVPIMRSKTVFGRPDTLDCELPEQLPALTEQQLDWLRTAVALTLNGKNTSAATDRWHSRMNDQHSYLRSSFEEWRNAILDVFCSAVFGVNIQAYQTASSGLVTAQQRQQKIEAERNAIIQKAVELVEDQSRYKAEIISKPDSLAEAEQLLNDEQTAVAFRHTPTSGDYKGQHFIVFTNASLLRLTQRAGLTEELYQVFKKRAREMEIMVDNSRTVKFGKNTMNGFWFYDKKF